MKNQILYAGAIALSIVMTPITSNASDGYGHNCNGDYVKGGKCESIFESTEGLIAIGFGLLVGITLFIACEEGDATISECFEDKDAKNFIETLQSSPIQPMLYVDDQEQTLGLRYTIRF